MFRKPLALAAILFAAAAASSTFGQVPPDQLAKPPADAKVWSIVDPVGTNHGHIWLWTTPDGTHWSRQSFNLRGFISEFDEQNHFAPDGTLQSLTVRGSTPGGDAAENYSVTGDTYSWTSPVDHGTGKTRPGLAYSAFGGTFESFTFMIDAMRKAPDHGIDLLPSGHASITPLTTLEVSNGTEKKTLTCYALTGFGLSPQPVWYDGDNFFAAVPGFVPQGWESVQNALSKAQDEALAEQAPALVAKIAKTPPGPVAFTDVKLYDSDARVFRAHMTVVVDRGRVAAVGPAAKVKVPANAQVIDGAGKTLIPGLWDNHQHYGDDSTGPLLLASGITSVRDPGNDPNEAPVRRKRIEAGELLGPRIVPSLLIDGQSPYTAQVAVVVHNTDEALAAVRRAKAEGYFAIKIYGSMDPKWVKPMATLAHQLGLHVHGHIPHGMRPLDAVHAGYDEITHINFVMMQAMPDDVVAKSNTIARIMGTAKYAADVDLHSPQMTAYLDELARRHIAVDPTLVVIESTLWPDAGEFPPSVAPYATTLPPQFARGFLQSAMAPTPDISRARMRASVTKLIELVQELDRRHITIVAGTDGNGFELIHELELYVQAGLTPAEALSTATIQPARLFGVGKVTGSLAKGKLAELALIDGDPEKSIGDLRQVELVMRDGKIMDAQALREAIGISGAPPK
jgi:cytosine/adenosine deaminase-related metal-dependent hydrolase